MLLFSAEESISLKKNWLPKIKTISLGHSFTIFYWNCTFWIVVIHL